MKIPLSSVSLSNSEKQYAIEAIETGWISGTGNYIKAFEDGLAHNVNRSHAIATNSGTSAILAALSALSIKPKDEVIVPALTFVAPASMVRALGAIPVFADITPDTWTIDPTSVERVRSDKTRAIIAVNVFGHPCDFKALETIGLPIIEDAAESHGALYRGQPTGSFGIASVFSFHANKTITTGEGGSITLDDGELANNIRLIVNHGMTPENPYFHFLIGYNFRMTNVTAAIGLGQIERWKDLVDNRHRISALYDHYLYKTGVYHRPVAEWATPVCWLYTVAHPHRDRILQLLRADGIDARAIWTALPDLPLYSDSCRESYPIARQVSREAFWLPTWANMDEETIKYIAYKLRDSL